MDPCLLDIQLRLHFEPAMKSLHSSSLYCVKPMQWKSKKYAKHDYSKFNSETFVTKIRKALNQL